MNQIANIKSATKAPVTATKTPENPAVTPATPPAAVNPPAPVTPAVTPPAPKTASEMLASLLLQAEELKKDIEAEKVQAEKVQVEAWKSIDEKLEALPTAFGFTSETKLSDFVEQLLRFKNRGTARPNSVVIGKSNSSDPGRNPDMVAAKAKALELLRENRLSASQIANECQISIGTIANIKAANGLVRGRT